MAEADLTRLGLDTLDNSEGVITPPDHDYTQYWRDYESRLFDAGYSTEAMSGDCRDLSGHLAAVSDNWLNGRLPSIRSIREVKSFKSGMNEYVDNLGHYNQLGEYGREDLRRAASLLVQASFERPDLQVEPLFPDEALDATAGARLLDSQTAFRAAESMHIATAAGMWGSHRVDLESRVINLYQTIADSGTTSPLLRFRALGHIEDIAFRQANAEVRQRANAEDGTVPEESIHRLRGLIGAQALRLADVDTRVIAGNMFESFVPLLLRVQALRELELGYDRDIGTFGVRGAFAHEDNRPHSVKPNPTFDTVIARVTPSKTVTTPVQLKNSHPDKSQYLPVVVFGNGVTSQDMRLMARGIAADMGMAEAPHMKTQTAESLHFLQDQLQAQLVEAA